MNLDDMEKMASTAKDILPNTVEETDGALSTVVGFFDHVVLYPVKKANITFKYKLENFEKDLREKTKDIPPENLQEPPTMISGPTLEALRYAYDEEELREMYENLLASAMDDRIVEKVHPSFVDAIKQMGKLDVLILEKIVKENRLACATINFLLTGEDLVYSSAMPEYFVEELCNLGDPFLISAAISNLERLALVKVNESGMVNGDYDSMKNNPFVVHQVNIYETFGKEFNIDIRQHTLMVTDLGKQFARLCMRYNK